jgi:hypothetical protein
VPELQPDATDAGDDAGESTELPVPGSTTSQASSYTERDSGASSVCSDEHSISEYEIVKRILYSTRANINMVHEVFRQVSHSFMPRIFFNFLFDSRHFCSRLTKGVLVLSAA